MSGCPLASPRAVTAMILVLRIGACDETPKPDPSSVTLPMRLYDVAGCVLDQICNVAPAAPR
jgi:hypothetical protein